MNSYEGDAVLSAGGTETPATVQLRAWRDEQSAPWGDPNTPPADETSYLKSWGGTAHPAGPIQPGDYTLRLPNDATAWVFVTGVTGGAGQGTTASLMGVDEAPFPVNLDEENT